MAETVIKNQFFLIFLKIPYKELFLRLTNDFSYRLALVLPRSSIHKKYFMPPATNGKTVYPKPRRFYFPTSLRDIPESQTHVIKNSHFQKSYFVFIYKPDTPFLNVAFSIEFFSTETRSVQNIFQSKIYFYSTNL